MLSSILSLLDDTGVDVYAFNELGLPWLMWDEHRTSGVQRVCCSIKAGPNHELLFTTDGSLLSDPVYWQRRWEKLIGFRPVPASELYYSGVGKRVRQEFMNKSALLRVLLPDDAVVMTAEFADEYSSVPMHLNYGLWTQTEVIELHNVLYQRFIGQRKAIVDTVCNGEFTMPDLTRELQAKIEARTRAMYAALEKHKLERSQKKNSFWGKIFG